MGAATIEMTDANFESHVSKGGIMFLDFWASWCGPCRSFSPIYEAAALKHADIVFGKVNTDNEKGLAQAFDIQSIPTLAIFRDGILLFSQAGALPATALEELVTRVRALDMDHVRSEIARRDAELKKKEFKN